MTDLPPLDQPLAHVVVGPDDQRGPYTLELLISEVVAGRLHEQTPVWWPGLTDWTTMASHPGVAAEVNRRRSPAPGSPSPFARPSRGPDTTPLRGAPGQYQEVAYPGVEPHSVSARPGQDFTDEAGAAAPSMESEAEPSDPGPEAPSVDTAMDPQDAGPEVPAVEVIAEDVTPADFAAVDSGPEAFAAAGAAEGLDPQHGQAFEDLVRRSRARADAAAIVASIDDAFTDAVAAAAAARGLEAVGRDDSGATHEMSYRADDATSAVVTLGKVTGHAMAVRDGEVGLTVTYRSSTPSTRPPRDATGHGEVDVSELAGGGSQATVQLLLPLADYVGEDLRADQEALRSDVEAVLATVAHHLR